MNKNNLRKILLFIFALLVMVGLGLFKEQNDGDRNVQKIVLGQGKSVEYFIDLGDAGELKYLLEPEVMTVRLECKFTTDIGELRYELEGLEAVVSQKGKKSNWQKLSSQDILELGKKGSLPLYLEIVVPRSDIHRRAVQTGKLKILNNDKLYATIEIKIINSRYQ